METNYPYFTLREGTDAGELDLEKMVTHFTCVRPKLYFHGEYIYESFMERKDNIFGDNNSNEIKFLKTKGLPTKLQSSFLRYLRSEKNY